MAKSQTQRFRRARDADAVCPTTFQTLFPAMAPATILAVAALALAAPLARAGVLTDWVREERREEWRARSAAARRRASVAPSPATPPVATAAGSSLVPRGPGGGPGEGRRGARPPNRAPTPCPPHAPQTSGIATHYGGAQEGMNPSSESYGTKEGSCGYGRLSKDAYPFWQVAAFSTSNKFFKSIPGSACGTCWEIQCVEGKEFAGRCRDGGGKSVTITITDSCPECAPDHMDLQALVFDKISPMALGRINMRYR